MSNIYIVAEIGCNHNGSVDIAREMILKAKEAGVNAVKFQTFKADKLISAIAPKAEYQIKNTGELESQLEMTKKLEMKYDDYLHLMEYAVSLNLDVFSTPFDEDSIDFLASLKQKIWKIPSGELLNLPYLEKIAKLPILDKKIIISTGMATIDEIKQSVSIFINNKVPVDNITILHCNTEYPTPFERCGAAGLVWAAGASRAGRHRRRGDAGERPRAGYRPARRYGRPADHRAGERQLPFTPRRGDARLRPRWPYRDAAGGRRPSGADPPFQRHRPLCLSAGGREPRRRAQNG